MVTPADVGCSIWIYVRNVCIWVANNILMRDKQAERMGPIETGITVLGHLD